MDISDPTQPNVAAQLSLPLGVPAGKTKKKISATTKRVRSPASERESEAILERILEHVKNVQNDAKQPALKELQELLSETLIEDSPLADASVKVEPLTYVQAVETDEPPRAENGPKPPQVETDAKAPRVENDSEASPLEPRSSGETEAIESSIEPKEQSSEESFAPDAEGSSRLGAEAELAEPTRETPARAPDDVLANADEIVTPSDGIEILVRMAKNGELDPKAVDIIDVTDKFLKLIAAAPKENLRQSGKILFHACVLLRMKTEALLSYSPDDDDPVGDDFIDFDEDGAMDSSNTPRQITFADLERAIVRKTQRRRVRPRPVTLDDLIEALREAERIEQVRADKKPKARIDLAGQHSVEGMDDLLDLAHDEDIETTIDQVEQLLAQILKFGENIELMKLVSTLGGHNDWVDAFLASLFLSNAGKIMLEQSEFYGPLYIALCGGQPSVANA